MDLGAALRRDGRDREGAVMACVGLLLVIAGLMLFFGFWPVALVLLGLAVLTGVGAARA